MNFVQTAEAVALTAINDVKAGLNFLKVEGEAVIAWVDKADPGAQVAMAAFVKQAESEAVTLTALAGTGLNNAIAAGAQDMETLAGNLIQATGLVNIQGGQAAAALGAIDVAGADTLKVILQGLASVAIATVLGKLAPAAPAA